jgi:PAS domain S-box-containing protein
MSAIGDLPQAQGLHHLHVLEALPAAIYTTDAAGQITYCNQAATAIFGERPAAPSDWWASWRLFRPDGTALPHAEFPMAVTLKERRPAREQIIAERPNGTHISFTAHSAPLLDDTGQMRGTANLIMDTSVQRRTGAEAQRMTAVMERHGEHRGQVLTETTDKLKESEWSFRMLVESVIDYAIFMLDSEGRVANWNPGAERIKGYSRTEIIGQHFSRFYTEEDRAAGVPEKALATARSQGRFEQENWRLRKDGSRFWASVIIDAIHDEQGQVVGFAKVTRDMTEHREMEEKLRQSQKMDALGQLTGGIAHDFNNLLTVIVGSLDILTRWLSAPRNVAPPSRVTRAIAAAKDASRRAATLTQRLLAFSRQQPLHPKTIDPNRLVHDLVEMLRRTLGERIAIKTVLGFDTGFIDADPTELENALLNLVVNSRDAMPDGGTITIETARVDGNQLASGSSNRGEAPFVLITVKDNGVGMDRQTLAKAFDPFFTTKEEGQGTGLGLSQVYGFVQQSGGQVQVDSQPGEGTSIQIYLPRLPDDAEESEPLDDTLAANESKGTETVLVVEDDDAIRGYCTDVLREVGYYVLEAPNAAAALEILDRQPDVRLLFTDIGLPGAMNGRQLSDEARQRRPELKVVLTTGYTGDTVIHTGRLERGVSLMVKPFSFADLTRKVRETLDA